jgi:hypothetical protein
MCSGIDTSSYLISRPILYLFQRYWSSDEHRTYLSRLEMYFTGEDPEVFAERVVSAFRQRQETDQRMKFIFYVENMPTEGIRTLETDQIAKIRGNAFRRNDYNQSLVYGGRTGSGGAPDSRQGSKGDSAEPSPGKKAYGASKTGSTLGVPGDDLRVVPLNSNAAQNDLDHFAKNYVKEASLTFASTMNRLSLMNDEKTADMVVENEDDILPEAPV